MLTELFFFLKNLHQSLLNEPRIAGVALVTICCCWCRLLASQAHKHINALAHRLKYTHTLNMQHPPSNASVCENVAENAKVR